LSDDFLALYELTYGVGTAWKGVPATLVNYSVTVVGRRERPPLELARRNGGDPAQMVRGSRQVYLPGERRTEEVSVYDDSRFHPGAQISGPAIIDAADTTIFVPIGFCAERDEYMNYILTREGER
jgi:N-methylhydantoinase A